jgi:hypothetical protein
LSAPLVAPQLFEARRRLLTDWPTAEVPGAKRVDHLRDNASAVNIVLGAEDLRFLNEACPPGAAAGWRYNELRARWVERSV